jgi:isoleucyl-tRNA synthetase
MTDDLKSTVFLPKTDFPMRAGLPKKEPEIQAMWEQMGFFDRLREHRKGAEKFILHDGPPYANGNLHIGHALNKILKDIINRFQSGLGKDANYIPGWDCHGLPIEWKIEESYRKKGQDKDQVEIVEFRKECRDFASHWVGVQSDEFQRLGVMGNWADPYLTMKYSSEAVIAGEIGKFLMNGALYRGSKPVMWSAVEKTALAEAEIEYFDRRSTTIYARFPVRETQHDILKDAVVIIWTTTPWTMPGNRATAYGEDISYGLYQIVETAADALGVKGEKIVLADDLSAEVAEACGITELKRLTDIAPTMFKDTILDHPMAAHGYDHAVPMLPADYVTTDQGTGIVHIAPGHGAEDYVLGLAHGVPVPETVGADGRIMEHLPIFAGMSALKDNEKIADILADHGALIGRGEVNHSYPHSWRSHAPLIFRNTPQWFISMETTGLRDTALDQLNKTAFYPPAGQTRLTSMIANRPDWCISRQRAWGVPIPVFVHKATGEPLRDQAVIDRVVEAFQDEGSDAWFSSPPSRFLGNDYHADDYDQVTDIVDVWFDSGSTHAFLLENNPEMSWPADMYLEGSDQHRGWFHSSLLEACGTRGRAPYKSVLTHGFVLDEQGRKMSKSLGNTVTPQQVIDQNGADILRLWVANSDYYDDLRIGKEIIQRQVDHYRRLRNTLRYLLGSLEGFSANEKVDPSDMPGLERWVLMRLKEIDIQIRKAAAAHDYHQIFTMMHHFCNNDLSAFYFDIRKDLLYCGDASSTERRACRTVMDMLFDALVVWLAPILTFTAEEAWQTRYPDPKHSVHFQVFPDLPDSWLDEALGHRWAKIRQARLMVTGAIEKARNAGMIKSSLQAHPTLYAPQTVIDAFAGLDAAEVFITSSAHMVAALPPEDAHTDDDHPDMGVTIALADGDKCDRCWKILPELLHGDHHLCGRCHDVISG